MPASNTDKFIKVAPNTGWQLDASGISDASVTSFGLISATSLPTDTAVILTIDRVNSSGVATPNLMERIVGVMSGTTVTSCVRGLEGTAQAHAAGAVVEIVISKSNINKLMEGILVEHGQDGTHSFSGLTSKATPIDADSLPIVDSAASNVLKRLTWANLKATLKTYFDTLYTKATGAEITTGTDDAKFATAKALADAQALITKTASTSTVATSQTTTSTSYTDLGTVGPTVTITTGTMALVSVYCEAANSTTTANNYMSFAISGATTVAAADAFALLSRTNGANGPERQSAIFLVTGLTPGSNVFTSKYKTNAGTATFVDRKLFVIPL